MLCSKCGKKEATVYYKQNINGKVTEGMYCADCAEELRRKHGAESGEALGSLFGGFGELNLLGSLFGARPAERLAPAKTCPLCGATFRNIVQSGKAGCAKCYEVFRDELDETVVGIHGRREHTGRVPSGFISHMSLERRLGQLGEKLKEAIENQEFEEAARLRDEINSLKESEGGADKTDTPSRDA